MCILRQPYPALQIYSHDENGATEYSRYEPVQSMNTSTAPKDLWFKWVAW